MAVNVLLLGYFKYTGFVAGSLDSAFGLGWSVPNIVLPLAISFFTRLRRNDEGQDLLEYGLLVALIAIIAMGAVTMVGNTILSVFWSAIAAASI